MVDEAQQRVMCNDSSAITIKVQCVLLLLTASRENVWACCSIHSLVGHSSEDNTQSTYTLWSEESYACGRKSKLGYIIKNRGQLVIYTDHFERSLHVAQAELSDGSLPGFVRYPTVNGHTRTSGCRANENAMQRVDTISVTCIAWALLWVHNY